MARRDQIHAVAPDDGCQWLVDFDKHLDCTVGLARRTRHDYLRNAERLLRHCYGTGRVEWSDLRPMEVSDFVRKEIARLSVGYARGPAIATRAFLRFLVQRGVVSPDVLGVVPRIRRWKLASLPRLVTAEQLDRAIASCSDVRGRCGLRDRAIFLLLSRLGLRAGEAVGLEFRDVNWREGSVSIRSGKVGRERNLPLPGDVGRALVAYLKGERRPSTHRVIFLTSLGPAEPLTGSGVSAMVGRRLRRAGVRIRGVAAHALRHTAATQMVRRGAIFKDVADVLGHRHLVTTHIYAKLDIASLAGVALPWQGGSR